MMIRKKENKKRAVAVIAGMLLGISALSGCKGSSDAVSKIQAAGSLQVAVCTQNNPYITLENGQAEGEEAELVKAIATALGVEANFTPVNTVEEAKEMVETQEADLALGMITDQTDTKDTLALSNPYEEGRLYVLTQRGDYSDSPAAFADRSVGVVEQMEASSVSSFQNESQVYQYPSFEEAVRALKEGIVDGVLCHLDEGIQQLSDASLQMQNVKNVSSESYVLVARKGETRLLSGINTIIGQYLDGQSEDGTAAAESGENHSESSGEE